MKISFTVAALLIVPTKTLAAAAGMFLCDSPVIAGHFWNDLEIVRDKGVQITTEVATKIASNHACRFVRSENLKPVTFVAGQLRMTDGVNVGWSSPELYIIYVNRQSR